MSIIIDININNTHIFNNLYYIILIWMGAQSLKEYGVTLQIRIQKVSLQEWLQYL